ncbi:MAG: thymidine kinase [Candidatus Babeliaceae bacterium]|nr:thymidine kinase [Candidatus Babeliaceae bacterium]
MHNVSKGTLEVICGSMFSGKSEELIRRIRRAEFAQQHVQVFKHSLDTRKTIEHINAHSGYKYPATAAESAHAIKESLLPETYIIAIDEIQFFDENIVPLCMELIGQKKRVIVAGLDLDFRGLPFGKMPELLSLSDNVTKLKAVCNNCGADAHHTQRLVSGKPADFNDPLIQIGAEDCYQARCRNCFEITYNNYKSTQKNFKFYGI